MTGKIVMGVSAFVLFAGSSFAFADEVTKTTTTTRTDPPVVVAPAAPAAVVTDDAGCSTKKVVKTDGDTGDTVKKTKTDCN